MDALNKWFDEATSTPAGSILLFLAVFLARVAIDQWTQRRALSRAAKKRRATGA